MKSGIYIIKNKINDKVYIGSSVNIPIRKYSHFYQLRNNRHHNNHLQRFYNIHGKENFVFEILKECREEDLLSWEQHYLDLYKDKFNQCEFAGHTLNRIFSEETKRKISNALKGKLKGIPKNEETKLKMRHPKSVEHAYKIKLAQEYTRKIVYQYNFKLELITIFNSVIEALCDTISQEYRVNIKYAKDVSAGAVLVSAILSVILGTIIFLPYILDLLFK